MATKQDLPATRTDGHDAGVFYTDPATGKPVNTGLREAALADWNSRLIVGKETVDSKPPMSGPPTRPL